MRSSAPPQRHDFTPTVFYRQFSPFNRPVLTINPGAVDAGGGDKDSIPRVIGGNPQTGPFYISTAMPRDALVIHILRLRLRNSAFVLVQDARTGVAVGSGRSIEGVSLIDALRSCSSVLTKFGGHHQAAGRLQAVPGGPKTPSTSA